MAGLPLQREVAWLKLVAGLWRLHVTEGSGGGGGGGYAPPAPCPLLRLAVFAKPAGEESRPQKLPAQEAPRPVSVAARKMHTGRGLGWPRRSIAKVEGLGCIPPPSPAAVLGCARLISCRILTLEASVIFRP